jgi:hypothetical protein
MFFADFCVNGKNFFKSMSLPLLTGVRVMCYYFRIADRGWSDFAAYVFQFIEQKVSLYVFQQPFLSTIFVWRLSIHADLRYLRKRRVWTSVRHFHNGWIIKICQLEGMFNKHAIQMRLLIQEFSMP